jgi:hypothetical protein
MTIGVFRAPSLPLYAFSRISGRRFSMENRENGFEKEEARTIGGFVREIP